MKDSIYIKLEKGLKSLPADKLREVMDFIKFLKRQTKTKSNFKKFFGCIKKNEADLMEECIEKACEKINHAEW